MANLEFIHQDRVELPEGSAPRLMAFLYKVNVCMVGEYTCDVDWDMKVLPVCSSAGIRVAIVPPACVAWIEHYKYKVLYN